MSGLGAVGLSDCWICWDVGKSSCFQTKTCKGNWHALDCPKTGYLCGPLHASVSRKTIWCTLRRRLSTTSSIGSEVALKLRFSISTASSKATTWQPSASFGFLKCTKATEKSYIQAKPDLSAKPYCLVNVQDSAIWNLVEVTPDFHAAREMLFSNFREACMQMPTCTKVSCFRPGPPAGEQFYSFQNRGSFSLDLHPR